MHHNTVFLISLVFVSSITIAVFIFFQISARQGHGNPTVGLSYFNQCSLSSSKAQEQGDQVLNYAVGACVSIQSAGNNLLINWVADFNRILLYKDAHCEDIIVVVVSPQTSTPDGNACFDFSKLSKILSFKGICKGWCGFWDDRNIIEGDKECLSDWY